MGSIDTLFKIERDINGLRVDERRRARQEQSAPPSGRFGSVATGGALPYVALGLIGVRILIN
jgi:hypothetical protein